MMSEDTKEVVGGCFVFAVVAVAIFAGGVFGGSEWTYHDQREQAKAEQREEAERKQVADLTEAYREKQIAEAEASHNEDRANALQRELDRINKGQPPVNPDANCVWIDPGRVTFFPPDYHLGVSLWGSAPTPVRVCP